MKAITAAHCPQLGSGCCQAASVPTAQTTSRPAAWLAPRRSQVAAQAADQHDEEVHEGRVQDPCRRRERRQAEQDDRAHRRNDTEPVAERDKRQRSHENCSDDGFRTAVVLARPERRRRADQILDERTGGEAGSQRRSRRGARSCATDPSPRLDRNPPCAGSASSLRMIPTCAQRMTGVSSAADDGATAWLLPSSSQALRTSRGPTEGERRDRHHRATRYPGSSRLSRSSSSRSPVSSAPGPRPPCRWPCSPG